MKEYIIPGEKINSIADFLKLATGIFGYPLGKEGDLEDFAAFAKENLEIPSIISWENAGHSHRALGYDYGKIINSIPNKTAKTIDGKILKEESIFLFLS